VAFLARFVEEILRQRADIVRAFAQRRHFKDEDREAVIKIGSERLRFEILCDVLIGRGDHARVDLDRAVAADAPDFTVLESAQQAHLHVRAHFADFIEEKRAAVRLFKQQPLRREIAPVNAPFSWPKSSLSSRLSGIAPQLIATNGPFLRGELKWMARASTSLPLPLSPRINTSESLLLARRDCRAPAACAVSAQ
jgi:hypothetical protein